MTKARRWHGSTWSRIPCPTVSIDTYQSFTGESWLESEFEWLKEDTGVELDWSNADVSYNHDGIRQGLSEASIEGILYALPVDSPIESIDYVSSWSPQFYNFETDSYRATYVVNLDVSQEVAQAVRQGP